MLDITHNPINKPNGNDVLNPSAVEEPSELTLGSPELNNIEALRDAISWLGQKPRENPSKPGSDFVSNSDEIRRWNAIGRALSILAGPRSCYERMSHACSGYGEGTSRVLSIAKELDQVLEAETGLENRCSDFLFKKMVDEDGSTLGYYINHPDFYCDLEEEGGVWSVYFRDKKTDQEVFEEQKVETTTDPSEKHTDTPTFEQLGELWDSQNFRLSHVPERYALAVLSLWGSVETSLDITPTDQSNRPTRAEILCWLEDRSPWGSDDYLDRMASIIDDALEHWAT